MNSTTKTILRLEREININKEFLRRNKNAMKFFSSRGHTNTSIHIKKVIDGLNGYIEDLEITCKALMIANGSTPIPVEKKRHLTLMKGGKNE